MATKRGHLHPGAGGLAVAVAGLWMATAGSMRADSQTLYATGFEFGEGFDAAYELPGQDGWLGFPYATNTGAVNASGIISNGVPGQEAYVGFFAPEPPRGFVSVWRPVNHTPDTRPLVSFDVVMTIVDSSPAAPERDNFRWSVYNINGDRLFSVDFDNHFLDVSYQLDGPFTNVVTARTFENDIPFQFNLLMDFQANEWSASMDGVTFLSALPITTTNAPLTLGDVDAVWVIYDTNAPGDNFMVFDDYRLTAAPTSIRSSRLEPLGPWNSGFLLRLHGTDDCRYAIEASGNGTHWFPLKTNVVTGGYFDYLDPSPPGSTLRLYRSRWVP